MLRSSVWWNHLLLANKKISENLTSLIIVTRHSTKKWRFGGGTHLTVQYIHRWTNQPAGKKKSQWPLKTTFSWKHVYKKPTQLLYSTVHKLLPPSQTCWGLIQPPTGRLCNRHLQTDRDSLTRSAWQPYNTQKLFNTQKLIQLTFQIREGQRIFCTFRECDWIEGNYST